MSEPEKPTSPVKTTQAHPPESPTTARELDFDDEPQETGAATGGSHSTTGGQLGDDVAPPKPPRPLSSRQQAENTLREAFPTIDAAVVKAVLTASGGQVEPAFNALLGMSDPDSQIEPTPPQPPRPVQQTSGATTTAQSQLEADEQYARQLAEHYSGAGAYNNAPRTASRGSRDPALPRPTKETGLKPNELYDDREHSFLDDDLPVIRENIRKGFLETQSKVNSWVTNLKKKIDGENEDDYPAPTPRVAPQGYYSGPPQQPYGIRKSGELGRRSGDRERYDADPQLIGDDFATLQLRDEEGTQRRPSRPLANPNLFKPTPAAPQSDNRRVSFQDGPPQEIGDMYRSSPDHSTRPLTTAGKQSKWQPLSAVDPSPVADADPFSLGDSDDERDARTKDTKADETQPLQKLSTDAMTDDVGTRSSGEGRKHVA